MSSPLAVQMWLRSSEQEQNPQNPAIATHLPGRGQKCARGKVVPESLPWGLGGGAGTGLKESKGVTTSWSVSQSPGSRKFTFRPAWSPHFVTPFLLRALNL